MATMTKVAFCVMALAAMHAAAQPFLPGQNLLATGNPRTVDNDGPYNLTLLTQQVLEIDAATAARKNYTDKDVIDFITNVECLEGLFDTWGTLGHGFNNNLTLGGPDPIGARKANLSYQAQTYMEEVALNEQGHTLWSRQAGSNYPCPQVDFTGGFNAFLAEAYNLNGQSIEQHFGKAFDPFQSDETFVTCVLLLEEIGAAGNKGLISWMTNPVLANSLAGLSTSAWSQATVERILLWERRNNTVQPFNETVQQVFARISALRDRLDGPIMTDQGLTNTDPRYIATSSTINNIVTDVRGLSPSRTPEQVINILTLGSPNGKGCFFPNGFVGKINNPSNYTALADGTMSFDANGQPKVASQQPSQYVPVPSPVLPTFVVGQDDITQCQAGPEEDNTANTRGLIYAVPCHPTLSNSSQPVLPTPIKVSSDPSLAAAGGR